MTFVFVQTIFCIDLSVQERKTVEYYDTHGATWHVTDPSSWGASIETLYKLRPGGKLLEVGVGTGREAKFLVEKGYDYIGVDASQTMFDRAQQNVEIRRLVKATVYDMPFKKNTFDVFWSAATLLYIPKSRIDQALQSVQSVIKRNAVGFISLKNGTGQCIDKQTNRLFSYYTRDEFEEILKQNSFELIQCKQKTHKNVEWLMFFIRSKKDT